MQQWPERNVGVASLASMYPELGSRSSVGRRALVEKKSRCRRVRPDTGITVTWCTFVLWNINKRETDNKSAERERERERQTRGTRGGGGGGMTERGERGERERGGEGRGQRHRNK